MTQLHRPLMITALGGLLTAGLLGAWGNSQLRNFQLRHYELPILAPGVLRGRRDFRILHLSDLHMIPGQRRKIEWVAALDALDPDLVINTGDNLSDAHAVPEVLSALGPLLRREGMFVFGSNDYWAPRIPNPFNYLIGRKNPSSQVPLPWKGMRAAFLEHGWHDLNNTRLDVPVKGLKLSVVGVDDPHHELDDLRAVAGAPNPEADLALGLTHAPYRRVLDQFAADGYHLTLAGHTHGGQLCLPGGRAIVSNCDLEPSRASGIHQRGKNYVHVSSGLGTSKFVPLRLWCPPTATLLVLSESA